ncbi:unnamed protein product [Prorocentrum cordatum]|uniref:Subtilisin n=1 Tax=Prorocentrum cordatum TaxID=2364126 RepID=A0ABN9R1E5_9DINO|nr:unnamed protein product [Polarella glacialis]
MGLTPVRHDILRTPSRQASYAPSRGPVLPGGDAPLGFSMADALGDGGWQRGLPCSAARGRATIATVVSAGGAPRTVSPVGRGAASPRSPRSLAQPPAARQLAPGSAHAPP